MKSRRSKPIMKVMTKRYTKASHEPAEGSRRIHKSIGQNQNERTLWPAVGRHTYRKPRFLMQSMPCSTAVYALGLSSPPNPDRVVTKEYRRFSHIAIISNA